MKYGNYQNSINKLYVIIFKNVLNLFFYFILYSLIMNIKQNSNNFKYFIISSELSLNDFDTLVVREHIYINTYDDHDDSTQRGSDITIKINPEHRFESSSIGMINYLKIPFKPTSGKINIISFSLKKLGSHVDVSGGPTMDEKLRTYDGIGGVYYVIIREYLQVNDFYYEIKIDGKLNPVCIFEQYTNEFKSRVNNIRNILFQIKNKLYDMLSFENPMYSYFDNTPDSTFYYNSFFKDDTTFDGMNIYNYPFIRNLLLTTPTSQKSKDLNISNKIIFTTMPITIIVAGTNIRKDVLKRSGEDYKYDSIDINGNLFSSVLYTKDKFSKLHQAHQPYSQKDPAGHILELIPPNVSNLMRPCTICGKRNCHLKVLVDIKCDICKRLKKDLMGMKFFGCNKCNFDKCEQCYRDAEEEIYPYFFPETYTPIYHNLKQILELMNKLKNYTDKPIFNLFNVKKKDGSEPTQTLREEIYLMSKYLDNGTLLEKIWNIILSNINDTSNATSDIQYNNNGNVSFRVLKTVENVLNSDVSDLEYKLLDFVFTNKKLLDMVNEFNRNNKNINTLLDTTILFLNSVPKKITITTPFKKTDGTIIDFLNVSEMAKLFSMDTKHQLLQYHFFCFNYLRCIRKHPFLTLEKMNIDGICRSLGLEKCRNIFSKLLLCVEGYIYVKNNTRDSPMTDSIVDDTFVDPKLSIVFVDKINKTRLLNDFEKIAYYFCILQKNYILNPYNDKGYHIHDHITQLTTFEFPLSVIIDEKPNYFDAFFGVGNSSLIFTYINNILNAADNVAQLNEYVIGIQQIIVFLNGLRITSNMQNFINNLNNNDKFKDLATLKIRI